MKKVIYSCITGGYDNIPEHKYVSPDWDYVLFTDNPDLISRGRINHWIIRPLAFAKRDNVRNARWHKINAHILFPEYGYSLWLDGNVSVNNKNVFDIIDKFISENSTVAVPLHPVRKCVYQEADTIINLHIDYPKTVKSEMRFLRAKKFPANNGLSETCILLRRHNDIAPALDLWWNMVNKYSKRDQLSFDYAMWKNNIKTIPFYDDNGAGTHRKSGDFEFTYILSHNQNKIAPQQHKFKIFYKERLKHGRRNIYICGLKVFSYTKETKKHRKQITTQDLAQKFYQITGKRWNEPLDTLSQKITWLQMFDNTPAKTLLADKYTVRKYVSETIGDKYLIQLFGCWNKWEEIDFTQLPNTFVLKFSEGSGKVFIVPEKDKLNFDELNHIVKAWQDSNFWEMAYEMQYKNSVRKIIAEQLIDTRIEYKLWCFHGKCKFIKIEIVAEFARNGKPEKTYGKYFWPDWTPADFKTIGISPNFQVNKPHNLVELLSIGEKLAKPFNFVRVDFYETTSGELKFGEMTFSPAAGKIHFIPTTKDAQFGKMLNIDNKMTFSN